MKMSIYGKVVFIIIFGRLHKTAKLTVNYYFEKSTSLLHQIQNEHEWDENGVAKTSDF